MHRCAPRNNWASQMAGRQCQFLNAGYREFQFIWRHSSHFMLKLMHLCVSRAACTFRSISFSVRFYVILMKNSRGLYDWNAPATNEKKTASMHTMHTCALTAEIEPHHSGSSNRKKDVSMTVKRMWTHKTRTNQCSRKLTDNWKLI